MPGRRSSRFVATQRRAMVTSRGAGVARTRANGDVVVPHPLAATIDHILPLALGGEHVYANVQTAHFLCNSKKADNVTQISFAA